MPTPAAPVQSAPSPRRRAPAARRPPHGTAGSTGPSRSSVRPSSRTSPASVAGTRTRPPAQVIEILERQYLTAVTSGGAAVGASAVIPGVGMIASLGLSGAETVGFLEASALFAQSVTEVHGITVEDPERARALVMAMMLGAPGSQLVKQLAGQAGGGQGRTAFWGELVTSSLPKQAVSGIGGRLRASFVKRFLTRQGTSILGRAIPFGIGAVVGGLGNHALGRKVVQSSRSAFGPPPAHFTVVLPQQAGGEPKDTKSLSKRQQRALDRGRGH
ncbi:hypothetical protein [Curtobacterium sp. MCPF17_052]|uniref:hypothetical protein n=1 Tax=Curtobacterium sp. MCPF17_052 TaxID=2175655 RepID=UPI0034648CE1